MFSKSQRRVSDYRRKRKSFHANQYTRKVSDTLDVDCISASAKKNCAKKIISTRNNVDLPPPVSQKSYERILRKINLASREVADDSMKNAAKKEVTASGSNEICVSGNALYLPKTLITPVPFWIAETGHRMGERNVRCDLTPVWRDGYL
ncbi:hypothetical protein TNCV_2343741 [Trichonephila clavipes]|nr:hypothetical protein TNCV_2343741 [Trichonephila clavipes]